MCRGEVVTVKRAHVARLAGTCYKGYEGTIHDDAEDIPEIVECARSWIPILPNLPSQDHDLHVVDELLHC